MLYITGASAENTYVKVFNAPDAIPFNLQVGQRHACRQATDLDDLVVFNVEMGKPRQYREPRQDHELIVLRVKCKSVLLINVHTGRYRRKGAHGSAYDEQYTLKSKC
jgi:hypothetical protein